MSKLENVKKALEDAIEMIQSDYCSHQLQGLRCGANTNTCYAQNQHKALADLKEYTDRLESEQLNTDMQIAYNQVLLNQPEDNRDATKAMRAALKVIKGAE